VWHLTSYALFYFSIWRAKKCQITNWNFWSILILLFYTRRSFVAKFERDAAGSWCMPKKCCDLNSGLVVGSPSRRGRCSCTRLVFSLITDVAFVFKLLQTHVCFVVKAHPRCGNYSRCLCPNCYKVMCVSCYKLYLSYIERFKNITKLNEFCCEITYKMLQCVSKCLLQILSFLGFFLKMLQIHNYLWCKWLIPF
jgi:hypothetical protein